MQRHLADDGQVLVYINRRGYSPTLACTACGWIAPCRDCDARLTVHLGAARLRCHHCGADAPLPEKCPQCGYSVKHVGQGTERVEETLAKLFPDMPIARLDRDVVRKRGDLEAVVSRIASGEARILVGTQMVTKGHDFPNVTLVVVLNADQGLFSTDFRAPERVAQTIIQVAGRAGRGTKPGEVLIQTEYPDHPLLQSLLNEGYDGFARAALAERAAANWPPFAHVAALRASATALAPAIEFLRNARELAGRQRELKLLGPAPAAMAKRAARYHAQLLIEARDRGPLHRMLAEWLPRVEALKTPRDAALVAGRGPPRPLLAACYFQPLRCASRSASASRATPSMRDSTALRIAGGNAELACCICPDVDTVSVALTCHSPPTRHASPAVRVPRIVKLRQKLPSRVLKVRPISTGSSLRCSLASWVSSASRERAARHQRIAARDHDFRIRGRKHPPGKQHAEDEARGHGRPFARAPGRGWRARSARGKLKHLAAIRRAMSARVCRAPRA